jgi:hypothetical protein
MITGPETGFYYFFRYTMFTDANTFATFGMFCESRELFLELLQVKYRNKGNRYFYQETQKNYLENRVAVPVGLPKGQPGFYGVNPEDVEIVGVQWDPKNQMVIPEVP